MPEINGENITITGVKIEDKRIIKKACIDEDTSFSEIMRPTVENIAKYIKKYGCLPELTIRHPKG